MAAYRLGVDVGGTFPDNVALTPEGKAFTRKVLSSPPNFNEAIRDDVSALISEQAIAPADVTEFAHGATVATNAIITRTGANTGLITTKAFAACWKFAACGCTASTVSIGRRCRRSCPFAATLASQSNAAREYRHR